MTANNNIVVKVHEMEKGTIVAVVDQDLLGNKFEEGDVQLDLTSDFYKGEEKSSQEVGDLLRNARGINLVGRKAIKLALEEGIIDEDMVKKIADVPYYQGTTYIT